jgi:dephospho-CoA kinase
MKQVVGLIGGIGSGKSLVAGELERHGAKVISGDRLGHEALEQPAVKDELCRRWGESIRETDGKISRRRVAGIVFADERERKFLEDLVFPYIERGIRSAIAAAQTDPRASVIVLDAAIMLEAGWNRMCDRLVFIDTPRPVRLRRLAQSRGWNTSDVEARELAQMPLNEKRRRADLIIENSGSEAELVDQVRNGLRSWGIEG